MQSFVQENNSQLFTLTSSMTSGMVKNRAVSFQKPGAGAVPHGAIRTSSVRSNASSVSFGQARSAVVMSASQDNQGSSILSGLAQNITQSFDNMLTDMSKVGQQPQMQLAGFAEPVPVYNNSLTQNIMKFQNNSKMTPSMSQDSSSMQSAMNMTKVKKSSSSRTGDVKMYAGPQI